MDGLVIAIAVLAVACLLLGYLLGRVGDTTLAASLFAGALVVLLTSAMWRRP